MGNLTRVIDRNERKTTYAYDRLDRQTAETWYEDESSTTPLRSITYQYDLLSRLHVVSDLDGSEENMMSADYTYNYDSGDRVKDVYTAVAGLMDFTGEIDFQQKHDLANRRVQQKVKYDMFTTLDYQNDYTRDRLGRLTKLTQKQQTGYGVNPVAQKRVDFTYNLASQFDTITRYNNLTGGSGDRVAKTQYAYDGAGRLSALSHDLAGVTDPPEIEYGFGYDQANRLTSFSNSAHPGEDVIAYTYDAKDQLTGVNYQSETDESYDYDQNGNRQTANGHTYQTHANNELFKDGVYTYAYDDEGNRETADSSSLEVSLYYVYDHRNRLTKAYISTESGTQIVQYTYDPFDRLVRRAVDEDGDETYDSFEYFVYDGSDPVLEFVDADGEGENEPELARRYLNGPAVDQVLAEEDLEEALSAANRVLWHLDDHQGTTRDLVDAVGEVIEHYRFDSYGNLLGIEDAEGDPIYGDPSTRFLYTGLFRDPTTGLYLTQTRWYDPVTGQWTTEDWIWDDTNSYRYVRNSPTNATDPNGLSSSLLDVTRQATQIARNTHDRVVKEIAQLGELAAQEGVTDEELEAQYDRVVAMYGCYLDSILAAKKAAAYLVDDQLIFYSDAEAQRLRRPIIFLSQSDLYTRAILSTEVHVMLQRRWTMPLVRSKADSGKPKRA